MRDGFKRLLSAFLALLFVGFGTALLCHEIQFLTKAQDSAGWSSTDGIVLYTDYERTSSGRQTSNAMHVTYSYDVQGMSYTSNIRALSYSDISLTNSDVFEQYPSGRKITVYYNPDNPQEATLEKGMGTDPNAGVRFAWAILGFAVAYLVYVTITEMKKQQDKHKPSRYGITPAAFSMLWWIIFVLGASGVFILIRHFRH